MSVMWYGSGMMKGFVAFLNRGNVIDLAVAVVVGGAFGAVVTALVKDLITPLIAAIFGKPSFESLVLTINRSHFLYGDFLNAIFSFICIAAAVYYIIVLPSAKVAAWRKPSDVAPATKTCPECLSTIPLAANRCMYCTSAQPS
jgi:large conductance mechanosensitive channel